MRRAELVDLLFTMKFALSDLGYGGLAGAYEDAEFCVRRASVEDCHRYADFVLARGRRGRVTLVLSPPYVARATAALAALLRSVVE